MAAETARLSQKKPSLAWRVLRTLVRALLLAFAIGFAIGTWLRCEIEQSAPRTLPYLGMMAPGGPASVDDSAGAA
jgi:hypothetical protein